MSTNDRETGVFGLSLRFDEHGSLPLQFVDLTTNDLRTILTAVEKSVAGSAQADWRFVTDAIQIQAHVNGVSADTLGQIVRETHDGFSAVQSGREEELPDSFDSKLSELAITLVNRVRRTAKATLFVDGLDPIELFPSSERLTVSELPEQWGSWSAIDGQLNVISVRRQPQFVIDQHASNNRIRCSFPDEWMETIKQMLGRRVLVEGYVRYRRDGSAISVNEPTAINVIDEPEKDILEFRGSISGITGELSAYDFVRSMRTGGVSG